MSPDVVVAADPHDLIPGLLHGLEDVGVRMHHEVHRAVTERVGVQTGQEAAAAWDAHGVLAVRICEGHALPAMASRLGVLAAGLPRWAIESARI